MGRSYVSVHMENWEDQRLQEASLCVSLDLPLDSGTLPLMETMSHSQASTCECWSVSPIIQPTSGQQDGYMGHSANSRLFDKSSMVWSLPDQKVQTGIKIPDKQNECLGRGL